MKFICTVFILVNFALVSVADGSRIEANHGEDVTLSFTMDKAEEAKQLKIIFKSETMNKSRLIARYCAVSDNCDVLETPGVKVQIGQGLVNVSIQRVNSSRAGLYEVDPVGKDMPEVNPITLVVKEVSSSSTITPPHTCTSNPPNSSNLFGLCALIPLVISVGRLLL